MGSGPFHLDEASLAAVVRVGRFRCALAAREIDRFESASANAEVDGLDLRPLLGVADDPQSPTCIWLREGRGALLVSEVEAVRDVAGARFRGLPTLTRLEHPIFRGVYELEDGSLLPVIDLPHLLEVPRPDDGG